MKKKEVVRAAIYFDASTEADTEILAHLNKVRLRDGKSCKQQMREAMLAVVRSEGKDDVK